MTANPFLRCAAPIAVVSLAVVSLAGCSDDKADSSGTTTEQGSDSSAAGPSSSDSDGLAATTITRPEGSQPLDVADSTVVTPVTCSVVPDVPTEEEEVAAEMGDYDVDCTAAHNVESFSISSAPDLDECYRVIADASDIVVVVDDEGELSFDDERIDGHSFGLVGDGSYQCQIMLAETRTEPLVDR